MTDDELYAAIQADPAIRAMAAIGDDGGAAAALSATLPPEVVPAYLTEGGILRVLGGTLGNQALSAIETLAGATFPAADPRVVWPPVLSRVVRLLRGDGVDFGSPQVRDMLDTLQADAVLTPEMVAKLKAAAERPAAVTHEQVSRAMLRDRPDGRIPEAAA